MDTSGIKKYKYMLFQTVNKTKIIKQQKKNKDTKKQKLKYPQIIL